VKHNLGAPFSGNLLALLASIRLGWKGSRLLQTFVNYVCKKVLTNWLIFFRSKEVKNVFNRYQLLREMIKETAKMEATW
jgi:hypothetical protein